MQFIIDNLTSLLVGAVFMIGLPMMALRAGESSRDATQADAARAQLLAFNEVMGQDFANVGAAVDLSLPAVVTWVPGATSDVPTVAFEFRGAVQPTATAPVEQIRYQTVASRTVTLETGTGSSRSVMLHQIKRSVWNGTRYVPSGASAASVTEFKLVLLRDDVPLGPGDDFEQADALEVTLVALVSPRGTGGAQFARWTTRHALVNLTGSMARRTP